MKKLCWFSFWFIAAFPCFCATPIMDVYGTDPKTAQKIVARYGQSISQYYAQKNLVEHQQLERIFKQLKQEEHFSDVLLDTVFYEGPTPYVTIEVVSKNDPQRAKFLSSSTTNYQPKKTDLIDDMIAFTNKSISMMLAHQLPFKFDHCPVHHCINNFQHPAFKNDLKHFNQGVVQQRPLVLHTLTQDKHPERRAAAAFLVGHFKDPQDVLKTLLPHTNDPDGEVRNNVLRVVAETIRKNHITTLDIDPLLPLLDSPLDSDRNKTLLILMHLKPTPDVTKKLCQRSGRYLIALLRLKQPNNHTPTYLLLKKISHQSYGEYDIQAWQQWINHAQSAQTA